MVISPCDEILLAELDGRKKELPCASFEIDVRESKPREEAWLAMSEV